MQTDAVPYKNWEYESTKTPNPFLYTTNSTTWLPTET